MSEMSIEQMRAYIEHFAGNPTELAAKDAEIARLREEIAVLETNLEQRDRAGVELCVERDRLREALNLIDDRCQDGSHFSTQILKIINAALYGNGAQARSE